MIGIIGSETTKNYGLFDDLKQDDQFMILFVEKTSPLVRFGLKVLRKAGFKKANSYKQIMSWEKDILENIGQFQKLIVIDTALRKLNTDFLYQCKKLNTSLLIECLLLNSVSSVTMSEYNIKSKFNEFPWDSILSFDPIDAEKHNWHYTGLHYYSKHEVKTQVSQKKDLFFAGSIVGERGKRIIHLLEYCNSNGITCNFICPRINKKQRQDEVPDGMKLLRKRITYIEVLQEVLSSNCILEILQEGQRGTSLRYFEAVCYNKKLLTTNADIKKYPFYDERYMKVFKELSDIDYDWVKKNETIDYGYTDEFSPKYLNHE